jgi:hypothetical protein
VSIAISDDKGAYDGPSLTMSGNGVDNGYIDGQSLVSVERRSSLYRSGEWDILL